MPSKEQEFSYPGSSPDELLQKVYGTFLSLGWTPKYVIENSIVGYTPRSWKKYDDEIVVTATENGIKVKSSLVHGEMFDALGKNEKHINEFAAAFGKTNAAPVQPEWGHAIEQMRQNTISVAQEQMKEAEEADKVMKQSSSNLYLTYGIIGINVIVFLLMAINGAGIFTVDDASVHIKWGSNETTATLSGEWWRLITCTFIHFGILHLAMNIYALYMAGVYLEPMLGKTKYITAYLCTGVASSIASLWWHTDGVNSAGASGAIFGLYGVFLALLLTNLIPKKVRSTLLQSIGVFVVYNLVIGMRAGVDNAGHIGGLLSGLIIGYLYYLVLSNKIKLSVAAIALTLCVVTVAGAGYFLKNYKTDLVRVDQLYKEFFELQDKATQASSAGETTASPGDFKRVLSETVLPAWKQNLFNLDEMGKLNMSSLMKKEQEKLRKYTELRIEETELMIKAQDAPTEANFNAIDEVRKKINESLKENKP